MAHSFFKFDFGRNGLPGNMEQANWKRLAAYAKKAQEDKADDDYAMASGEHSVADEKGPSGAKYHTFFGVGKDSPELSAAEVRDVASRLSSAVRDTKWCLSNFNGLMDSHDAKSMTGGYDSIWSQLSQCEELLGYVSSQWEHVKDNDEVVGLYNNLEQLYGYLKRSYDSRKKNARVAHRVWDIVSNDGIPTAHRKVDEMQVINRDHKRLADTADEIDVGDQVVMFSDGMKVNARVASVQSDGTVVLNVNGTLVGDIDPAFVFPA